MNVLKWFFVFLNTLVFIITTVLTVLSVLLLTSRKLATKAFNFILIQDPQWVDMIVVVARHMAMLVLPISLLIWLLSICGMSGASCSTGALLLQIYIAAQLIMVLVTLIVILLVGLRRNTTERRIFAFIRSQLFDYYDGDHSGDSPHAATLLIDTLQIYFQCCGINGTADFDHASNWPHERQFVGAKGDEYTGLSYPASCCMWRKDMPRRFIAPFALLAERRCVEHSVAMQEQQERLEAVSSQTRSANGREEDWDEEAEEDWDEDSFQSHEEEDDGADGGYESNGSGEEYDGRKSSDFSSNADRPCVQHILKYFDSKVGYVYAALGMAIGVEATMSFVACVVGRKMEER